MRHALTAALLATSMFSLPTAAHAQAMTAEETPLALELSHQPLVCTGCGLCLEHCPTGSIQREASGAVATRKLIVKEFPRCNECGEVFKPAGRQLTCFDCLLKGRQSVFGPATPE